MTNRRHKYPARLILGIEKDMCAMYKKFTDGSLMWYLPGGYGYLGDIKDPTDISLIIQSFEVEIKRVYIRYNSLDFLIGPPTARTRAAAMFNPTPELDKMLEEMYEKWELLMHPLEAALLA